jgi:adenine/guanine phosphoribosyltransferase-like PRPP-binding protein
MRTGTELQHPLHLGASHLAAELRSFGPTRVVYIETGGAALGKAIAHILGIPSIGIDIRYPYSRISSSLIRFVLFPIKELLYRLSSPSIGISSGLCINSSERIALVDDTASSGKTLRLALDRLSSLGISRDRIRIAVLRAGFGAEAVVDFTVESS